MDPLVLASGSPRRREILHRLGIPFVQYTPHVDEGIGGARSPRIAAIRVSRRKAQAGVGEFISGLVVGIDTLIEFNGKVLGKPGCAEHAYRYLRMLSGNRHRVFSGITVWDASGGRIASAASCTAVFFQKISDCQIREYVCSGEWEGKAGGYAVQGVAGRYVRRIEGSYHSVMGLPVEELHRLLDRFGFFTETGVYAPRRRVT